MPALPLTDPWRFVDKPPKITLSPGEFVFAAAALAHGHIYSMCRGLKAVGATLRYVYDPDPKKVEAFRGVFPEAVPADSLDMILHDPEIRMVAAAGIPAKRCEIGLAVMDAGKDYFVDKAPMTTLAQVEAARAACARTGRRYFVYFNERLHNEASAYASLLWQNGFLGDVIQVLGTGPHRHAPPRADWFYSRELYGGILCDIGSHQIEQFLFFTGNEDARILHSKVGNYMNPQYPEMEDFGDCTLLGDNGATGYFRVDWLTPDGLSTWGDGRLFLLGTKGYLEIRKQMNPGVGEGNRIFFADGVGEYVIDAAGTVGSPFFAQMVTDALCRTETAMTQAHIFKAAELCILAETNAMRVK